MLIIIDRSRCIGAAPCIAIAKETFQLDSEGKAMVIGPITDEAKVTLAAQSCPMHAIFLYDNNKNQIFPNPKDINKPYEEQLPSTQKDA